MISIQSSIEQKRILESFYTVKNMGYNTELQQESSESDEEAILMHIVPEQDGRVLVQDTTIPPFSAQGRLIITVDGMIMYGSGTLISSRFVLTAAHNLYSHQLNKEVDSIIFIPALNGSEYPYGRIGVRRCYYPQEFKYQKSEDYAILELEENIEQYLEFLQIREHTDEEIDNKECCIYGYPAFIHGIENNHLYGMSGKVSLIGNEKLLRYKLDTSAGQSGAGIYYYSQEENKYFIIGVHTRGSLKLGYNEGTLLTSDRIDRMKEWMEYSIIPTKHNLGGLTREVYGRDYEIKKIGEYMKFKDYGAISLSGMAGAGKSTIALKFANDCIGKYQYIWWINSETEDNFNDSVLAFLDLLGIDGTNYQERLCSLREYLRYSNNRFLFILDNLEDEDMLQYLLCGRGYFIITTRLTLAGYERIEVNTLSREASVQLLYSRLEDKSHEDLESLANFLQDLPLALVQAAYFIPRYRIRTQEYIQHFSRILRRDDKLNNIVSRSLHSLCEESKHILKIVCLGYNESIPHDMVYNVFRYKYTDTSEFDFHYYLGEIVILNMMRYDTKTGLLKIHKVLYEACTLELSSFIDDELIQHYSEYLYYNYNLQVDTYNKEEVEKIKHLTLHAESFLSKYKSKIAFSKGVLLQLRTAYSRREYFSNYSISKTYIKTIEQALQYQTNDDFDLVQAYIIIQELYKSTEEYSRGEEYQILK